MAGNYSDSSARYDWNEYNRYENLDGVEWKIINHLINSTSKHAEIFWKILKYNDLNALSHPNLTKQQKWELISKENGSPTNKRLFLAPFVDDAWQEQCSSVYIYVEEILPTNRMRSDIVVTVETIVHSKISVINGNWEEDENNLQPNPNDLDGQGNIAVAFKSRATVLLKSILAELNGLYLDGIGYLQLNRQANEISKTKMPLWNNRSFYGHSSQFVIPMSGCSDDSSIGF